MKTPAGKWGKRTGWVLAALLAVYCLIKVADFAWYRTQIPIGFQNANWSGEWRTQQYWGFTGRLVARLPSPLPENEDFKAEALVYYPCYCAWKTGQFVKMDFTGHFSPDVPTSTGQTLNPVNHGGDPGGGKGGKLKFKGTVGDQVVEYVALIDPSQTRIVGGYLSQSPNDYGHFWLHHP